MPLSFFRREMEKVKVDTMTEKTVVADKSTQKKLEYLRQKHSKKVKGMFKFYEVPGGEISFPFLEFKGDPLQQYTMKDGEVYEIPLGVALHLNKNCWYPVHHFEQDPEGKASVRIGKKVRRMGFQSLEFTDVDLGEKGDILTAEKV